MTLDDYLAEVDLWKEAAERETRGLSAAEREAHYREVRAWLEAKIGRPLPSAPSPDVRRNHSE